MINETLLSGAILVQNTAWQKCRCGLKQPKTPHRVDPEAVLSLSQTELIDLIRASGFYRNKAKAIHNVFQWFDDRNWDYAAVAASTTQTELCKQLLALPGVGQRLRMFTWYTSLIYQPLLLTPTPAASLNT